MFQNSRPLELILNLNSFHMSLCVSLEKSLGFFEFLTYGIDCHCQSWPSHDYGEVGGAAEAADAVATYAVASDAGTKCSSMRQLVGGTKCSSTRQLVGQHQQLVSVAAAGQQHWFPFLIHHHKQNKHRCVFRESKERMA